MTRIHARPRRSIRPLNDFQVLKGLTEDTMKTFGGPVMAHHEARLLVRNDQERSAPGFAAVYAIYRRSENRILQIFRAPRLICLNLAA